MTGVNCFGIPDTYRGWRITQECDDRFYGWGPNYDADYNDEDGFVGNGECVQGCNTWPDLREEIDAYIEEHPAASVSTDPRTHGQPAPPVEAGRGMGTGT